MSFGIELHGIRIKGSGILPRGVPKGFESVVGGLPPGREVSERSRLCEAGR
jgi:hypothetical protein